MNFSAGVALALGYDVDRLNHWNFGYVVRSLSSVNFFRRIFTNNTRFPRYSID